MTGTLLMQEGDGETRRGFKVGWGYDDKQIVVMAYVGVDTFAADVETVDGVVAFLALHGLTLPEAAVDLIGQ